MSSLLTSMQRGMKHCNPNEVISTLDFLRHTEKDCSDHFSIYTQFDETEITSNVTMSDTIEVLVTDEPVYNDIILAYLSFKTFFSDFQGHLSFVLKLLKDVAPFFPDSMI